MQEIINFTDKHWSKIRPVLKQIIILTGLCVAFACYITWNLANLFYSNRIEFLKDQLQYKIILYKTQDPENSDAYEEIIRSPSTVNDIYKSGSDIKRVEPASDGKTYELPIFLPPVEGKIISSYGRKLFGFYNDGINISGKAGSKVNSAASGEVAYVGNDLAGYGNLILIRHEGRWLTAYAHLDEVLVREGDKVKAGQPVGTLGKTGSVNEPQLHFEIRDGITPINPQIFVYKYEGK